MATDANLQYGISTRSGDITNVDADNANARDVGDATVATLHGNGELEAFPDLDAALKYMNSKNPAANQDDEPLAFLIYQVKSLAEARDWDLVLDTYDSSSGKYIKASNGASGTDVNESASALEEFGVDL
jgi:hypothetical protein